MTKTDYSYGIIPVRESSNGYQMLLIQQAKGYWSFPKGHTEEGETPIVTARREMFEETGIRVDDLACDRMFTVKYQPLFPRHGFESKEVGLFLAFPSNHEVAIPEEFQSEVREAGWFDYLSVRSMFENSAWQKLVDEVVEYLHSYEK